MILFAIVIPSFVLSLTVASEDVIDKNDCQPVTWPNGQYSKRDSLEEDSSQQQNDVQKSVSSAIFHLGHITSTGNVSVGEINCRYSAATGSDVNYYSCTELATQFDISNDVFFLLNPTLYLNCSNVQPYTEYCVSGCEFPPKAPGILLLIEMLTRITTSVIEPLRATDGKCGPLNRNATCLGTDNQCCNAETWTCGSTVYAIPSPSVLKRNNKQLLKPPIQSGLLRGNVL